MNSKYKILWLDDEPLDAYIKIINCQDEFKNAIDIQTVKYNEQFITAIEDHSKEYHAVILDVNCVESEVKTKEPKPYGLIHIIPLAIKHNLLIYIFSGQINIDDDCTDLTSIILNEYKVPENHIFEKEKGATKLFEKIIKDLNNKYQYYIGHEYILDFFSEGWIDKKYKSEFMDPIMMYYSLKDINSAHGNHMRNLTERMLLKVNEKFSLDTKTKENDSSRFTNIIQIIKNSNKIDSSRAVIGPLRHMIEISNAKSHDSINDEERELYFQSDFSTFFIITKWFYKVMTTNSDVKPTFKVVDTNNGYTRSGAVVETHKEDSGTYVNLKVKIPNKYKDCEKLYITGVRYKDNHWIPYFDFV